MSDEAGQEQHEGGPEQRIARSEQRIARLEQDVRDLGARLTELSREIRNRELERARAQVAQAEGERNYAIFWWILFGLTVIALVVGYAVIAR